MLPTSRPIKEGDIVWALAPGHPLWLAKVVNVPAGVRKDQRVEVEFLATKERNAVKYTSTSLKPFDGSERPFGTHSNYANRVDTERKYDEAFKAARAVDDKDWWPGDDALQPLADQGQPFEHLAPGPPTADPAKMGFGSEKLGSDGKTCVYTSPNPTLSPDPPPSPNPPCGTLCQVRCRGELPFYLEERHCEQAESAVADVGAEGGANEQSETPGGAARSAAGECEPRGQAAAGQARKLQGGEVREDAARPGDEGR